HLIIETCLCSTSRGLAARQQRWPATRASHHSSFFMLPLPPLSTLFPYTTLFRSSGRRPGRSAPAAAASCRLCPACRSSARAARRSEEHTSELQSLTKLVCRLLLEKKTHWPWAMPRSPATLTPSCNLPSPTHPTTA